MVSPHARPAPPSASDAELTNMAQRLEAALRRPVSPAQGRTEPTIAKPMPSPEAGPRPPSPLPFGAPSREAGRPSSAKPEIQRAAPAEAAHSGQSEAKPKSVLDSLEQEMASLLGRPVGKE
jgi:hypothetical protein